MRVFADANILFSRVLRDYLLYSAHEEIVEARWSQGVLNEMSKNLRARLQLSKDATDRLEALMNDFLPDALVTSDVPLPLPPHGLSVHPKDWHVLSSALVAKADALATDNVKDFPSEWMRLRGVALVDAETMILTLIAESPERFLRAHALVVRLSASRDQETVLRQLEKATTPNTVAMVRAMLQ